MSHIAEAAVKPGEPQIRDLRAVERACQMMPGQPLEFRLPRDSYIAIGWNRDGTIRTSVRSHLTDAEIPSAMHFRSWKDDNGGRLFGDAAVPEGWTAEQLGNNAAAVVRLKPDLNKTSAYELGVVPDLQNPGCFKFQHDYFLEGYGLEEHIGKTELDAGGNAVSLAPKMLMFYQMACDALAAESLGDAIEFCQQADGSWTSAINTEARVSA